MLHRPLLVRKPWCPLTSEPIMKQRMKIASDAASGSRVKGGISKRHAQPRGVSLSPRVAALAVASSCRAVAPASHCAWLVKDNSVALLHAPDVPNE